jgi:tetratricopeptide (TPR) repeat protein
MSDGTLFVRNASANGGRRGCKAWPLCDPLRAAILAVPPGSRMEGSALYTPQRLFGEERLSSDILSHEPFLERARLQREQERDEPARLALGAYVVARLIDRLLNAPDTQEELEGFRWQLEAVRRHVDELPPKSPETAHLLGIVDSISPHRPPEPKLWKNLTAYAYFLEHEGRLEEGLEMLSLAARCQGPAMPVRDFTAYALFAGRLNRLLAKWDIARACYGAAEEAGLQSGDQVAVLRGRLGKGAVYRGQGNLPAARETAETVAREAEELRLHEPQAIAYGDLGVVYGLQGLRLEALQAYYRAFQLSTDPLQRMHTLGDLGVGLHEIGAYDAARVAFQIVADSGASTLVRVNALVELMDLESSQGNRMAFERCRARAEEHRARMSPSMSVDYHYKVGVGLARFGQLGRAREWLTTALQLAEEHRLNAWYFRVEQTLRELTDTADAYAGSVQVSDLSDTPAIREMEEGLREYAASGA